MSTITQRVAAIRHLLDAERDVHGYLVNPQVEHKTVKRILAYRSPVDDVAYLLESEDQYDDDHWREAEELQEEGPKRSVGDKWKGKNDRWFTINASGRVVPTKSPQAEDAHKQKQAKKDQKSKEKEQAGGQEKAASRKGSAKADPQAVKEHMDKMREAGAATGEDAQALKEMMAGLTVAQINTLKKEMGLKASGNKAVLIDKLSSKILDMVGVQAKPPEEKPEVAPEEDVAPEPKAEVMPEPQAEPEPAPDQANAEPEAEAASDFDADDAVSKFMDAYKSSNQDSLAIEWTNTLTDEQKAAIQEKMGFKPDPDGFFYDLMGYDGGSAEGQNSQPEATQEPESEATSEPGVGAEPEPEQPTLEPEVQAAEKLGIAPDKSGSDSSASPTDSTPETPAAKPAKPKAPRKPRAKKKPDAPQASEPAATPASEPTPQAAPAEAPAASSEPAAETPKVGGESEELKATPDTPDNTDTIANGTSVAPDDSFWFTKAKDREMNDPLNRVRSVTVKVGGQQKTIKIPTFDNETKHGLTKSLPVGAKIEGFDLGNVNTGGKRMDSKKAKQAIADAYEDLSLLKAYRNRLVPLPALYKYAKRQNPDLSLDQFHEEVDKFSLNREAELHELNEVHELTPADRFMTMFRDGRVFHYFYPK